MALLFCEGFDGLDSSGDLDGLFARSSTAASGVQLARGRGRLGGHALRVGQTQHAHRLVPEAATLCFGFWWLSSATTNAAEHDLLRFNLGGADQCRVVVFAGALRAKRGTTTLATAANTPNNGSWNWIEGFVTIADAGGRLVVWVDGQTHLDVTADTRNLTSGAAALDSIDLCGGVSFSIFDDLILYDLSGGAFDSFPRGPLRIDVAVAGSTDSNTGTVVGAATAHAAAATHDGDGSYVELAAAGQLVRTGSAQPRTFHANWLATSSTGSATGGRVYVARLVLTHPMTVDAIRWGWSTAQTPNATPVIYGDANGLPGTVLATGPMAAAGSGDAEYPLSPSVLLPAGTYWVGLHVANTATYLTPDTTNALYGFETVWPAGSIGATGAWSAASSSNHACATLCGTLGTSVAQTVHAVAAGGVARNSDFGSLTARGVVTSGGVAATGASVTVGADFTAVQAMVYADPATGVAWTGAAAASAVFGVERLS